MKKILLIVLLATVAGVSLSAQGKYGADSAECIKYLSYYQEYYKQKNYDDATPNWRNAMKFCPPTANQNMIVHGTTLLRRLIAKNAANPVYKKALIDSLLFLYDLRAENYPKYAVTALNNKGLDLFNYVKGDPKRLFTEYEKIIEANGLQTKIQLYLFDFNAGIDLYKAGEISSEQILGVYQRNSSNLEQFVPANPIEEKQKAKIKNDLGSIFATSRIASCEDLINLYSPRLAEDPDNLQLATTIVKTMNSVEDCQNNDLFIKGVETLYRLEPSAKSAYYLYRLYSAKGETHKALEYMQIAIDREDSDEATDAEYTYELATFCFKSGLTAKAYEIAMKVPGMSTALAGKAYFLIGTIWGSVSCGGNEIAKRAPYWVACDYMHKAKNADPELTEEANAKIAAYSKYFPQTAEAFMYDITNGQSYTVTCAGMKAVTTVRTVN